MAPSDVCAVIPNCTAATDESQGEDEQMRCVAMSAGRRRVVVMGGGGGPGHGQLMRAHALQVAQVLGVQRSLACVCVCVCGTEADGIGTASRLSLQPHHTRSYGLL